MLSTNSIAAAPVWTLPIILTTAVRMTTLEPAVASALSAGGAPVSHAAKVDLEIPRFRKTPHRIVLPSTLGRVAAHCFRDVPSGRSRA